MKKFSLIILIAVFIFPIISRAQMKGATYKINADSINAGGGSGTSASYILGSTMAEAVNGEGSSASYKTKAGFQYMIDSSLTLTVDTSTKDLGSLLPGSPITGQTTATVTTDSWNGYSLNISKNHKMRHTDNVTEIADVNGTIATPLLWQAPDNMGFGFTIISGTNVDAKWGSSSNYKYAAFPDLTTTFHSKTGYKAGGDDTVIGYKVDTVTSQKSGAYSCAVTYTAVGEL
jgi:hypothetical protein